MFSDCIHLTVHWLRSGLQGWLHTRQQEMGQKKILSHKQRCVCCVLNLWYYKETDSRSNSVGSPCGIISWSVCLCAHTHFLSSTSGLVSFLLPHLCGLLPSPKSRCRNFQWPRLWFRFRNDLSLWCKQCSQNAYISQFIDSGMWAL